MVCPDRVRLQRRFSYHNGKRESDSLSHYRTKTGELVSSVEQLEMTIGELKRHRSELVSQLKSMKIRLRDVQSLSTTAIENRVEVFVPIRDTIFIDTGKVVKAQSFHWSDAWTSIQGVIQNDSKHPIKPIL